MKNKYTVRYFVEYNVEANSLKRAEEKVRRRLIKELFCGYYSGVVEEENKENQLKPLYNFLIFI